MSGPKKLAVLSLLRADGTVAAIVHVRDDGSVIESGNEVAAEVLLPLVVDRLVKHLKRKEGV